MEEILSNKLSSVALVFLLALCGAASDVYANQYRLDFSAYNFSSIFGSAPAPDDPVAGSFIFSALSPIATISALHSISINIDGHQYLANEVGTVFNAGFFTVGGISSGVTVIYTNGHMPDFALSYFPRGLGAESFLAMLYTTTAGTGGWVSSSGTAILSSVPEPTRLSIMLGGLGAILGISVWKRSRLDR